MKRRPKAYRVRWVYDEVARFEECNGGPRPLTAEEYAENEYMKDGQPVPYAEYLQDYGNLARHVYLGCIVEMQCPCCDSWKTAGSLWNIDFRDDNPEYHAIQIDAPIPAMKALALPNYAAEVARELLAEAGMRAAIQQQDRLRKANKRARAQAQADAR